MTRDEYQALDERIRENIGDGFDYWIPSTQEGPTLNVAVRMTPDVREVFLSVYAPSEAMQ